MYIYTVRLKGPQESSPLSPKVWCSQRRSRLQVKCDAGWFEAVVQYIHKRIYFFINKNVCI